MKFTMPILALVVAILLVASQSLYTVHQTQYAIKFQLGEFGQLLPPLAREYDLRDAVLLAELNLDVLLARRNTIKSFRPLPAYPAIRRDVAAAPAMSTTTACRSPAAPAAAWYSCWPIASSATRLDHF